MGGVRGAHTECAVQRVRQLPGQHITAVSGHDRCRIHATDLHWHIRDACSQNLICVI